MILVAGNSAPTIQRQRDGRRIGIVCICVIFLPRLATVKSE
jgi:hypothetical protein